MIRIAIDGPAGAGKSTIARAVARRFGFTYVDTGAIYRCVGLFAQRRSIAPGDHAGILSLLPGISVTLDYDRSGLQRMRLNGEDVTEQIRLPEISRYASGVSAIPEVRQFLLKMQRDLANSRSVVMDGRDIGTVVVPDAELKVFLTASPEARARRRWLELRDKGVEQPYETVLEELRRRDFNDSSRAASPLRAAEDAVLVDTTECTLEESIQRICVLVEDRLG